jgi:hypothetical protein
MTPRELFITKLREIANFYEAASDELPLFLVSSNTYIVEVKDIPTILRDCGKVTKSASGGYISLKKELGHVTLEFQIAQEKVCERKVVGQRWVEPRPAVAGTFVDQVEWECKPILKAVSNKK